MTKISEHFKKDKQDEKFLEQFNNALIKLEGMYLEASKESEQPILFICGAPRSGTTLITQVLAKTGFLNYVTNFVARFWMTPFVGLYLEKLMGIRDMNTEYTFGSFLGRTPGILDPHEFTYFWKYWLKPDGPNDVIPESKLSEIDVSGINKEVNAMIAIYNKPIFFKTYLVMINPLILHKIFKNAHFIILKRDLLSNALSILDARKKYFGNKNHWWSIKPSSYYDLKDLSVEEQIVGQIKGIYADIDFQIEDFRERTISLSYEEFCRNPIEIVSKIDRFLNMTDIDESELRRKIPKNFAISNVKGSTAILNRFKKALAKF